MKIYIVTSGEYSDYSILAAFLDETKAEVFVEKYNRGRVDKQGVCHYGEAIIEEYEDGIPFDFETMNLYAVRFYHDGSHDIVKKELCNVYDFQRPFPCIAAPNSTFTRHKYIVEVAAKDEEHAFKIACDALAKWKAEKEGL